MWEDQVDDDDAAYNPGPTNEKFPSTASSISDINHEFASTVSLETSGTEAKEVEIHNFNHKNLLRPLELVPLISHVTDVLGDGNCGFRSAAISLGRSSDEWIDIWKEMLEELDSATCSIGRSENFLKNVWLHSLANLKDTLSHFSGPAPMKYWMHFPSHGYILADTYRQPVILFSKTGSCTYLPLSYPPNNNPPLCFIMITEMAHLITFCFKSDLWAAPPVDYNWEYQVQLVAKPWKEWIKENLDHWQSLSTPKSIRKSSRKKPWIIDVE